MYWKHPSKETVFQHYLCRFKDSLLAIRGQTQGTRSQDQSEGVNAAIDGEALLGRRIGQAPENLLGIRTALWT